MKIDLKLFHFLFILTLLLGCTTEEMPAPSCRVEAEQFNDYKAPAACLINLGGKLLVLKRPDGKFDIPVRNNFSDESAQCAAHRAVWEDTGLNVEVGTNLGILNQEQNLWVYECELDAGFDGSEEAIPVPYWATQVKGIGFIDPFAITLHEWHKPDEFVNVRDAFTKQIKYKAMKRSTSSDIDQ
ncbi:NUDIX hydrolase [Glaciecola sp. 1036]|uniref:NUDIX hydrolase n=1 Tax=Alteromonadaceae TaxID=72275 RepID=UPI003D064931